MLFVFRIQAAETKWRESDEESNFKAKWQEVACAPMMMIIFLFVCLFLGFFLLMFVWFMMYVSQ